MKKEQIMAHYNEALQNLTLAMGKEEYEAALKALDGLQEIISVLILVREGFEVTKKP
jgi:hypothetical protein